MGGVCSDPKPLNFPSPQYLQTFDGDQSLEDESFLQLSFSHHSPRSLDAGSKSGSVFGDFSYSSTTTECTPDSEEDTNFGVSANNGMISELRENVMAHAPITSDIQRSSSSLTSRRDDAAGGNIKSSNELEAK